MHSFFSYCIQYTDDTIITYHTYTVLKEMTNPKVQSGHFGIFVHPRISRTRGARNRFFLVVTDSRESLLQVTTKKKQLLAHLNP